MENLGHFWVEINTPSPWRAWVHLPRCRARLVHRGRVLAWRVSITLEADFCIEALEEALTKHGAPELFNTEPRQPVHIDRVYQGAGRPRDQDQHGWQGSLARQRLRGKLPIRPTSTSRCPKRQRHNRGGKPLRKCPEPAQINRTTSPAQRTTTSGASHLLRPSGQ